MAGENITAAMHRIESMMDKVVEGFEKQLDQLFQGDALDITTDVEVLERMLSKDGLSSSDDCVWVNQTKVPAGNSGHFFHVSGGSSNTTR